jgi:hypothetical protein
MGRVVMNPNFKQEYVDAVGPEWQREVGELGATAISAAMPIETGNMRLLLDVSPFTDDEGRPAIRYTGRADYTGYVDQGTGLYGPLAKYITPKTAKALSWIGPGGKRITRAKVAGQRGQHFFYRGLRGFFNRVVEHPFGR